MGGWLSTPLKNFSGARSSWLKEEENGGRGTRVALLQGFEGERQSREIGICTRA